MGKLLRIGTRESQLAVWQATLVQELLAKNNVSSELVFIKSEGDIDLQTPIYEMGVQGVFTRSLDIALLDKRIDLAVHSMKDVPTQLPKNIVQASVLARASYKDILVYKGSSEAIKRVLSVTDGAPEEVEICTIATSSIRRRAQWLHRYPHHQIENLRGNVNTRLRKVQEHQWTGAIFAAAGLERINLRPENSIELDWMLPAPAQGAIMVVCREADEYSREACAAFNHPPTDICTRIERDFLKTLLGGCSTPISAHARLENDKIIFRGNILSVDGKEKYSIERTVGISSAEHFGITTAKEILAMGASKIVEEIEHGIK